MKPMWTPYTLDDTFILFLQWLAADDEFFSSIKSNSHHVLQPYLPYDNETPYQLRARSHTLALINKTKFLNDADFIIRLLYKYSD